MRKLLLGSYINRSKNLPLEQKIYRFRISEKSLFQKITTIRIFDENMFFFMLMPISWWHSVKRNLKFDLWIYLHSQQCKVGINAKYAMYFINWDIVTWWYITLCLRYRIIPFTNCIVVVPMKFERAHIFSFLIFLKFNYLWCRVLSCLT